MGAALPSATAALTQIVDRTSSAFSTANIIACIAGRRLIGTGRKAVSDMSNHYLVLKLPGNWIEREQKKQRIKMFADNIDVLEESNVYTCHATKSILKEMFHTDEAFKNHIKGRIAVAIGEHLLEKGMIRFNESESKYGIVIDGEITVISETSKGGAE